MIGESISLFVCLTILLLLGLGPALWVVPIHGKQLLVAAAIAPACGLPIIATMGFPLIRYVGPVQEWVWPVTIALTLGSLMWAKIEWQRRSLILSQELLAVRTRAPFITAIVVTLTMLVSPLLVNGIQYAVFRSNPSDAFTYITFAESFRVVDWRLLYAGSSL